MLLEPLFNDPALRKTNFVLLHGGWPFSQQLTALLTKPNVWVEQGLFTGKLGVEKSLILVEQDDEATRRLVTSDYFGITPITYELDFDSKIAILHK